MAGGDNELLAEAQAALERGDGAEAVERFAAACLRERSGVALEGLARAHYLCTDCRAATAAHVDA